MTKQYDRKWQVMLEAPEIRPIMSEEIELLLGQEDFVKLVLQQEHTNFTEESACE